MLKPRSGRNIITASEISQYVYCPVSWHLKRSGVPMDSPGLERGVAEHERAGGCLRLAARRERTASLLRMAGLLLAFAALILLGWILWTSS
ncbi:MAG: hypothetical protein GX463_02880 [Methanothrix sp.]|nr:hypothetical protein [Methanothrix sp.]HPA98090.1 hypothetical protein [Methanothrix sp.]HPM26601.1 hypothetical protein [Methanothrix sp.]